MPKLCPAILPFPDDGLDLKKIPLSVGPSVFLVEWTRMASSLPWESSFNVGFAHYSLTRDRFSANLAISLRCLVGQQSLVSLSLGIVLEGLVINLAVLHKTT